MGKEDDEEIKIKTPQRVYYLDTVEGEAEIEEHESFINVLERRRSSGIKEGLETNRNALLLQYPDVPNTNVELHIKKRFSLTKCIGDDEFIPVNLHYKSPFDIFEKDDILLETIYDFKEYNENKNIPNEKDWVYANKVYDQNFKEINSEKKELLDSLNKDGKDKSEVFEKFRNLKDCENSVVVAFKNIINEVIQDYESKTVEVVTILKRI